jgi:N-acetyl-anhydromuramyl-L-alanine amidase AmpD
MSNILKPEDMPDANIFRVILHWTGGGPKAAMLDRGHYHFIVNQDSAVIRGVVKPNIRLGHTRNLNSNSIGVSLAGMLDAKESPFDPGKYPITEKQYETAAKVVADLVKRYELAITPRTILCHEEVTYIYGPLAVPPGPENLRQRGKWDVSVLPWDPHKPQITVWAEWRTLVGKWVHP